MKKGEGTALVLVPVVKVTDLSESFGLVESRLDSHPVNPSTILGVHGEPPYRSKFYPFIVCFHELRKLEEKQRDFEE